MIHLVGIVFSGGVGISLYDDGKVVKEPSLIWSLVSAMSMFSDTAIDMAGAKGFSEIKCGKFRIVVYDPFKDNVDGISKFTYMALQDVYDNYFITTEKLKEIHTLLLPLGLDSKDPLISFQRDMNRKRDTIDKKISKIATRTEIFPNQAFNRVNKLIQMFLEKNLYRPLVVMINDIDGGLITFKLATDFFEDFSFTELILSNVIAENPNDAKSVWIERKAPDWIQNYGSSEAFIMLHVGTHSDFRILTRIVFNPILREQVRKDLNAFQSEIDKIISSYMK
ncbi:MAG: hypothetical protein ACTSP4_16260 [Candidatus Hodarchaeales archaeon]